MSVNTDSKAKVIRTLPVADAMKLFTVSVPRVIYVEECFYRGATFGGHFLVSLPPYRYESSKIPKKFLNTYLRWFSWQPQKGVCRITLLSDPKIVESYAGEVVTDLGRISSDAFRYD